MNTPTIDELAALTEDFSLAMLRGHSIAEIHGVSTEDMDTLYAFAHRFYQEGRLQEAERFFHFLCIYDMYNSDYWCGYAAIKQLQGQYQRAIEVYSVAFHQGKDDYRPMFYIGQCQLALGKPGKAKLCFEYAAESLKQEDLRAQALAYLKALAHVEADHSQDANDDNE
jgi:type III secretion system low calcium response chaperone LcrH/SycD